MTEPYHKYVFINGEAKHDFESMYQAENTEMFDSWHQEDVRALRIRLVTEVLRDWNFSRVLDVGCGKGIATQFLKKANNYVHGVDGSKTALAKARASFPDIEFSDGTVTELSHFNLVSVQGTLGYMSSWSRRLQFWSTFTDYCIVAEYIPSGALGEVKSIVELVTEFGRWYEIITKIIVNDEIVILFGKTK